ncbi:MAG TPA: hypothetical protein VFZ69_11315 [Longimicrobiales bacterium]
MEALIPISFFMCVAAVLILRPMTKRVGGLLEALTRERTPARPAEDPTNARMLLLLDQVSRRLDLIEERLDFTERLVSSRNGELRRPLHRASASEPELLVR